MPALTDVPRSSDEWRAFLQLRVAGSICAAVWVACKAGKRSATELETIDTIATIATASCIGLTSIYGPPVHRPELAAIMGVIIFLILRAIVIPSTGPRTTTLGIASVLPGPIAVDLEGRGATSTTSTTSATEKSA